MKNLKTTLIAIVLVLAVAFSAYTIGAGGYFQTQKADAAAVLYNEDTVTSIFNNASPAVVEIYITERISGYFGSSLVEGQGSGFIIDSTGNILTNNHVVDSAATVNVKLSTGATVKAEVLGKDTVHDLALVKVDAAAVTGITPLTLGNSDAAKIGQMAIAIGNPYGLDNTVTVGIISGKNRSMDGSVNNLTGMLQTDAALNPGNSGGPLLDASGSVIGINTAIETDGMGGSARGIGFSVPSNIVASVLDDLKAGKTVTRPWIGVNIRTLDEVQANSLKLAVTEGLLVLSVVADSPAAKAGIVVNDVVTAVDGTKITTSQALQAYVGSKVAGDFITLTVVSGTETKNMAVTLEGRPVAMITEQTPGLPERLPAVPNFPGRSFQWK